MFITFEGLDGSGKTTQLSLLAAYLESQEIPAIETREPGGTRIGDQIRSCLHDVDNTAMSSHAEILLYSASRAQLVQQVIRPALVAGQIVLCDRFADSTLAYQGYGRGLDLKVLRDITYFATGGLTPDLTLFFDLEPQQGLQRRSSQGDEMNRMDRQAAAFYERVRQGYGALIAAEPARWVVVDAGRPPEVIHEEVCQIVMTKLARRQSV